VVVLPFRERKAGRAEIELLHALIRLANQLQSNLDLDAVVEVIATALSDTFGFNEASVYVREGEGDLLRAHAAVGTDAVANGRIISTPCSARDIELLLVEQYRAGAAYLVPDDAPEWTTELRACLRPQPGSTTGGRMGWHGGDVLLVPLLDERRRLAGLLTLADPASGQRPGPEMLSSLGAFATHAAVAIENAREHEQLSEARVELEAQLELRHELLDASRALLSTLDEVEVFAQISQMLDALVSYDALGIGIVDRAAGVARPTYFAEDDAPLDEDAVLPLDDPVAGPVVRDGRAVLLTDEEEPGRVPPVPGATRTPDCLILAPLSVGGEAFGLLGVGRYREAGGYHCFDAREFELVELFANLAAIALHNARSYKEMMHLASSDGLTGVHNYRHFRETLSVEVSRADRYGETFCLLMMDLDHFKAVNDTVGHQRGDEVLKAVASILKESSRESDYAARYGGEEFVMILPRTQLAEARNVAERVRAKVSQIDAGAPELAVSMSIGVAAYPDAAKDMDEVLGNADGALLRAKAAGRNRVCLHAIHPEEVLDGEFVALGRRFARHIGMSIDEESGLVAALAALTLAELGDASLPPVLPSGPAAGAQRGAAEALLYGTERWDGGGYPEGLEGRRIPRVARVFALLRRFEHEGNGPRAA
jgi:diguanylate cyclase (GGDEF)-like protein